MLNSLLAINTQDLLQSLGILWKGLLAIAIVICAIILVTALFSKLDEIAEKKKTEKEAASNDGDETT